jgi:hypothetical protein
MQFHKGHKTWSKIDDGGAHDVHVGLLKFSWVLHEAVRQLRLLQSCRFCSSHSLQLCNRTMVDKFKDEVMNEKSSGSKSDQSGENLMNFVDRPRRRPGNPGSEMSEDKSDVETKVPITPFDFTFDDYASAPLQTQDSRNQNLGTYTFEVNGVPLIPSPWFQWRDRGWRLPHKTFFQTVHSAEPKSDLNSSLNFPGILKLEMQPLGLFDPDSLDVSATQLLDEAGSNPGSHQSKRATIIGRKQQGGPNASHLILNLEKDSEEVAAEDVNISVDLDSLIWVTTASGFQTTGFNMHVSPSMSSRPGISNNNFISVTLMDAPWSDKELQNAHLRGSKNVSLSQIPHIDFGFCGSAERRINFFIFFPRMVHKPDKARRYATLLPLCVQDLWYDKVIIPSCCETLKSYTGLSEYLPPSLQDLRNRLQFKQKSVIILDPSGVMKEVKKRIDEGGKLLSCFGSFFVVADGRGMKVATKQCIPPPASGEAHPTVTFDQIKHSLPDLSWDRMQDRTYGELYLDIGISYHCNSQEPLTGLWRIPCLKKSFTKMGSLSPKVHPLGTLAFYGGLKAEMSSKSKQDKHIISRISYCLAFETIRSPGTAEYLCSNKDIVERTPKFLDSVRKWSELFLSAQSRPFGVRDEIRGLASTVISFLPVSFEKVAFSSYSWNHTQTQNVGNINSVI